MAKDTSPLKKPCVLYSLQHTKYVAIQCKLVVYTAPTTTTPPNPHLLGHSNFQTFKSLFYGPALSLSLHKAHEKTRCCVVKSQTLLKSEVKATMTTMIMVLQTKALSIHPSQRTIGEQRNSRNWRPYLECNLLTICRPPQLCLIFKQTPVKSPCLISHSSWKLAEISTSSSHQKQRGTGANVAFIPTICACVKYRFLWKAQRTSSTFH